MAPKIPLPDETTAAPKTRNMHARRPEARRPQNTAEPQQPKAGYDRQHSIALKLGGELKANLDAARLRTAYATGSTTVADFVRDAIQAHITELEKKYNNGRSFLED